MIEKNHLYSCIANTNVKAFYLSVAVMKGQKNQKFRSEIEKQIIEQKSFFLKRMNQIYDTSMQVKNIDEIPQVNQNKNLK